MANINAMKVPQITWSTYTASLAYPLDNWSAHSEPREGSAFVITLSGLEDSWIIGTNYVLSFDVRWIPGSDIGAITGWDGTGKWREFIEWGQAKNTFKFWPDKNGTTSITSYLAEPQGAPSITVEPDGTRSVKLTIRNSQSPYDGY